MLSAGRTFPLWSWVISLAFLTLVFDADNTKSFSIVRVAVALLPLGRVAVTVTFLPSTAQALRHAVTFAPEPSAASFAVSSPVVALIDTHTLLSIEYVTLPLAFSTLAVALEVLFPFLWITLLDNDKLIVSSSFFQFAYNVVFSLNFVLFLTVLPLESVQPVKV